MVDEEKPAARLSLERDRRSRSPGETEVEVEPDRYLMRAPKGLRGTDLFLHEASVMATENAVMAAALARGTTTICNAASEPHVQELCELINAMGGSLHSIDEVEVQNQPDGG